MIDVLVVGSGAAGLSVALEAKKKNKNVVIISKTYPTASQTSQAQGGINAVLDNNKDSIQNHIDDTLRSAHNLADKETVEFMCKTAKDTIKWLDNLGVPFSRDNSNNIAQRQLGGAKYPRACYSSDYTGLKILHTLYDSCIKEGIKFINEQMLLELLVDDDTIKGIVALDIKTSQVIQYEAKSVVLATGGYSGVYHNYTTNSTATTGDGIASALYANIPLVNMEYIQFHPTALKDSKVLVSESARGEGGYLITQDNKRFVNELKPRDEVSRAIYNQLQKGEEVYLDLRHLGKEKILEVMPQEYDIVSQFASLSLDKDLIPVQPISHYTMGGIKVDKEGKTTIKNLYAVGECSANNTHGANRLGGNSLLEVVTFGRYIGKNISYDGEFINTTDKTAIWQQTIEEIYNKDTKVSFYSYKTKLGKIMYDYVGLYRDEKNLLIALEKIKEIKNELPNMGITTKDKTYNTELKEFLEFKNIVDLAICIVVSALERKESRGAHYRVDYKNEDIKYQKNIIITKDILDV